MILRLTSFAHFYERCKHIVYCCPSLVTFTGITFPCKIVQNNIHSTSNGHFAHSVHSVTKSVLLSYSGSIIFQSNCSNLQSSFNVHRNNYSVSFLNPHWLHLIVFAISHLICISLIAISLEYIHTRESV